MDERELRRPERSRSTDFHIALAGILFPPLSLIGCWILAMSAIFRRPTDPEDARWQLRLVGLAVVDVLVAAGLVLLLVAGGVTESASPRGEEGGGVARLLVDTLLTLAPVVVVSAIVLEVARRRGRPKVPVWRGVLAALLAADAATVAVAYGSLGLAGRWTVAGMLLALVAQSAAMMGMTLLCRWWLGPPAETPIAGPRLSPVRATLQGVYYLVTGLPRAGILLAALQWVLFGAVVREADPLQHLASAPMGPWAVALFLFAVAVLGPVAEELLFRGFLLPRVAARLGAGWALGVSTVVFALLHTQYGWFMPLILVHGLVLGWARLRTGGLAAPIALHVLVNTAASTAYLLGT